MFFAIYIQPPLHTSFILLQERKENKKTKNKLTGQILPSLLHRWPLHELMNNHYLELLVLFNKMKNKMLLLPTMKYTFLLFLYKIFLKLCVFKVQEMTEITYEQHCKANLLTHRPNSRSKGKNCHYR